MNENVENIDISQMYSLTYPKYHEGTPCPLLADSEKTERLFVFERPCNVIIFEGFFIAHLPL